MKIGNGSNNANLTFIGGALSVSYLHMLGLVGNGLTSGNATLAVFSNLTLNATGNLGIGKSRLVIGGSSTVNVGGVIGGTMSGIANADWGTLTIQDSAVVAATGGVNGAAEAWILNLNGGTLVAKSVQASDREDLSSPARLTFNGTVLKPTQDTNNFVTVGANVNNTFSALVGSGGAIFDTDGKNIAVAIGLKASGSGGLSKRGAGTLTLSGTNNTFTGGTAVNGGTLSVTNAGTLGRGDVTVADGCNLTLCSTAVGGAIADTNKLTIGNNATVTVGAGVNETVYEFYIGTQIKAPGVWGRTGGSAPNQSDRILGDGTLTVAHSKYSWNTNSATWDTTSANWVGADTFWSDNGDAFFTNTAAATTVTVNGPRIADTVRVGNGTNNATFTFAGGPLTVSSLLVQGLTSNSKYTSGVGITTLNNLTLANIGNMAVGSWTLAIGGSSAVTVGGTIGGPDWGTLTIKDSAVVTVSNGVNSSAEAWMLNLNGGTLITKNIKVSDRETSGSPARLTFNGTIVKPLQNTNDFVTVGYNDLSTASALVGNGGAIFDTDGKNIAVTIGLKASGSGGLTKLGAGTLTLVSTNNTYTGATMIGGGCLAVSGDSTLTNAVPIANASFETYDGATLIPNLTPSAYRFAPTGAGWTFSGQAGITTSNSYFMIANPGSDGACAAYLYGAETFSQTVTVANAGLYDLRFMALKGRSYNFNSLVVKIDGTPVCSYASFTLTDDVFRNFESKGIALSAGTHTLLFQTFEPQSLYVNGKLPATVIDRVTLTPATGGRLPSDTAVNITAAGASYAQNRSSQTVGSLAGVAGSIVSNSGILTVGGSNTNTTFAGIICGSGSLVKTGTGTLTLGGANTYTGATTAVAGTLEITAPNALPATTALEIATGAAVKLSNANEQTVSTLTFDGVQKYRGTWGAAGSGARMTRAQFSGTGVLRVLNGPACPGTFISLK